MEVEASAGSEPFPVSQWSRILLPGYQPPRGTMCPTSFPSWRVPRPMCLAPRRLPSWPLEVCILFRAPSSRRPCRKSCGRFHPCSACSCSTYREPRGVRQLSLSRRVRRTSHARRNWHRGSRLSLASRCKWVAYKRIPHCNCTTCSARLGARSQRTRRAEGVAELAERGGGGTSACPRRGSLRAGEAHVFPPEANGRGNRSSLT